MARQKEKASGAQLAQITRSIVQYHHEFYGKGPTEARSYAVNDTIICILKGGFTVGEKTLLAEGQGEQVERMRRSFQEIMKDRFVEVVREALDREVIGYMSQINADPQVAVEIFLLEPHEERWVSEFEGRFDDHIDGSGE